MKKTLIYVIVAAVFISAAIYFYNIINNNSKNEIIRTKHLTHSNYLFPKKLNSISQGDIQKYKLFVDKDTLLIFDKNLNLINKKIIKSTFPYYNYFNYRITTINNNKYSSDSTIEIISFNKISFDSLIYITELNLNSGEVIIKHKFSPFFKFNETCDFINRTGMRYYRIDSIYILCLGKELTDCNKYVYDISKSNYFKSPNYGIFKFDSDNNLICINRIGDFSEYSDLKIIWQIPFISITQNKEIILSNYFSNKIHIYDIMGRKINEIKINHKNFNFKKFLNSDLLTGGCGINTEKYIFIEDSTLSFGPVYYLSKYKIYLTSIKYPKSIKNGISSFIFFDNKGKILLEIENENIYNRSYHFVDDYLVRVVLDMEDYDENYRKISFVDIDLYDIIQNTFNKPWWKFW
ncbi:MAG: hypothetical protein ACK4EX_08360 [Thermaurantimonas sp.]|uniref:hypothetical protein n=1 Tax=Thermaurantimonas sp. TaxID=2681568 RepID=UPI00391908C8